MIRGQPDVACGVFVAPYLLDAVVPDAQDATEPVSCPHAVTDLNGLDRPGPVFGAYEGPFCHAGISART